MKTRSWRWDRWAVAALLLVALALRVPPMLENRFHPDEALYGYWGLLIANLKDVWLAGVPVYKPPLFPYVAAVAQGLLGNREFAVRLPGLVTGVLAVPLVDALVRALYRDRTVAVLAAVCVALSPMAIVFSATAFLDPPMVTFGLAACVAAARRKPGWAGLLAGLSFAAKQTGLVWLPLAVVFSISRAQPQIHGWFLIGLWKKVIFWVWRGAKRRTTPKKRLFSHASLGSNHRWAITRLVRLALAFAAVAGAVFLWDAARVAQGAQGFWGLGVAGYGGLRFIWPQELGTRLTGWAQVARQLFGSSLVNGLALVGLPVLVWHALTRVRRTPGALADLQLVSFLLAYAFLHWLWAFPIWDRYLLPLVPILSILVARVIVLLTHAARRSFSIVHSSIVHCSLPIVHCSLPIVHCSLPIVHCSLPIIHCSLPIVHCSLFISLIVHCSLFISLLFPALNASRSASPIGNDPRTYDGIDQVTAYLNELPEGTVVYQHWLGWQYNYYLFGGPISLAYWPTPTWLAGDVQVFGSGPPRYITFPSRESSARVEFALARVGYGLEPVLTTTRRDGEVSFALYCIQPLSDP